MFDDLSPNAIIILVVMVIGGIRWVIEQIRGGNRNQDDAETSEFEELYEEARLEILERQARNDPDAEEVARQLDGSSVVFTPAAVPPQPPPVAPPPLPPGFAPPVRETTTTKPAKPGKRDLTAAEKEALANFEALGETPRQRRQRRQSSVSAQVRKLLSNPTSAQDAIVLADILGPPKGMRQ